MPAHPTAVVHPGAQLGPGGSVGEYSIVGPEIRLGPRVRLHSHVVLEGRTSIGEDSEIFPFSVLGARPGHLHDRGEATELVIGARCVVRESASIHRGSNGGSGKTQVGDECMLLGQIHIAHDCRLGRGVTMMNGCLMAGHVEIGDFATLGGNAEIHQFVRIGPFAMLGGGATVRMDVPPYCMAAGYGPGLHGLNEVGLERRGFKAESIRALRAAYRTLFRSGLPRAEALLRVRAEHPGIEEVALLSDFVASSKRGIARHGRGG